MKDRKTLTIEFPTEFDWYYSPVVDLTKHVTEQNKEMAKKASAIDAQNLPSKAYEKTLKDLFN